MEQVTAQQRESITESKAAKALTSRDLVDLIRERREALLRIAYRMVGAQVAEDIVQDTITVAFEQRLAYSGRGQPFAWLCGIVMNLCRAEIKRRSKSPLLSLSQVVESSPAKSKSPLETMELTEQQQLLQRALAQLPEKQRASIILVNFEKLTARQVGECLNLSEAAVWKTLSRARENLRSYLHGKV